LYFERSGPEFARIKSAFWSSSETWPDPSALCSPHNQKVEVEGQGKNVKNIFVGNLDFAATESAIRSLFEAYGTVDRVNLVTDRDTGRPRGFAFVEMTDSAAADRAIAALNGTDMGGRTLNINEARPKGEGGRGGSGGGFRREGGGGPRQRREPRW
jgi:cold-inducible RNA-binding protein